MPIVKAKPTSPGRRFVEKVVHPHLYKGVDAQLFQQSGDLVRLVLLLR